MKQNRFSKSGIAKIVYPIFRDQGYAATAISELAKAVALSKASLYYHFPEGKKDMATYVLAYAGSRMQATILAPLGSETLSPVEAITASMDGVALYYDGETPRCLMNSLMLGAGADLFSPSIHSALNLWSQTLSSVLQKGGVSSQDADFYGDYTLDRIQGSLITSRVKGGRSTFDKTIAELKAELLALFED